MCYYSLKLTAAAVAVWFVYAIITAFIYRRVIGFQRNLVAANNREAGIVQQIFKGLAKFREHGAENQAFCVECGLRRNVEMEFETSLAEQLQRDYR